MTSELYFECDDCDRSYKLYEEAMNCCGADVCSVYQCTKCGKDFYNEADNEAEADACCIPETEAA